MLIDSHCHLDMVDLTPHAGAFERLMAVCSEAGLTRMLCAAVNLEDYPAMRALVDPYPWIDVAVGVHPNHDGEEASLERLLALADDPRVVAIGEAGLDYYRGAGDDAQARERQHQRLRTHIAAAHVCGKPLIIHTRAARADTIAILREQEAAAVGGVLHCFTEDWEMARQGLDLGFYISFSGILTFNSAKELREIARRVPLDRLLIETDSPYLAPVPYRGKPNEPHYVRQVAECLASLRDLPMADIAAITAENYHRLFAPMV